MEIIPALGSASEWADEVDAVSDALLPLAGDLHAGVVVVDDEEGGGGQLQVVLLLEVLRRPEKRWDDVRTCEKQNSSNYAAYTDLPCH